MEKKKTEQTKKKLELEQQSVRIISTPPGATDQARGDHLTGTCQCREE
jgi:hypothetical protein